MGKRLWGRPRKRWMDFMEEDLERLGVQEWREVVQDGEKWRDVVIAAKTLRVLSARERKRRNVQLKFLLDFKQRTYLTYLLNQQTKWGKCE